MIDEVRDFINGKTILVTGGAGSIGKALVKTLAYKFEPKVVRLLDVNETEVFNLQHELKDKWLKLRFFIGDIRDKDRLKRALEDVDIIFHAAALKHVPLCEYNAFEAVKTNVIGTQNLIDVAIEQNVEKFITISTDKAVNPHNVMGATKLLAEKLTIAANTYKGAREIAFSVVRFGNVLNSRGSILPLWENQIKNRQEVTLTDERMTRFFMTMNDAINLILKSAMLSKGGEIFVLKMPKIRVKDLLEVVVEHLPKKYGIDPSSIKVRIIGRRPGEKLHESLLTEDELEFSCEIDDLIVIDALSAVYRTREKIKECKRSKEILKFLSSKNGPFLSKQEIKEMLEKIGYLK